MSILFNINTLTQLKWSVQAKGIYMYIYLCIYVCILIRTYTNIYVCEFNILTRRYKIIHVPAVPEGF